MPYLDEAARKLGISEKSLRAWLRKVDPPIEPQRHKYDLRYRVITDEEFERIRQARAERPGQQTSQNGPVTRSGANLTAQGDGVDTFPIHTASKRAETPLPEGWMSRTKAAELHHFPHTTLIRWCERGLVETSPETFTGVNGQFDIQKPITARGLQQFYRLASRREDFERCPSCPHDIDNDAGGDETP